MFSLRPEALPVPGPEWGILWHSVWGESKNSNHPKPHDKNGCVFPPLAPCTFFSLHPFNDNNFTKYKHSPPCCCYSPVGPIKVNQRGNFSDFLSYLELTHGTTPQDNNSTSTVAASGLRSESPLCTSSPSVPYHQLQISL